MISIDQFVNEWNGKSIDVDGFPPDQPYQCYDAFIQYNREVIGCQPTIICRISGYVKDFWNDFENTILPQYYTKVGPLEKGQKSDVCIWGNAPATPYSHIAVLLADNGSTQHIFGQNQPNPYCSIIDFTSNGLLGYLRPKEIDMGITIGQVDKVLKMGLRRGPTPSELNNPAYQESPGLLIDTVWNNGGETSYNNITKLPVVVPLPPVVVPPSEPVATPTPPVNEQEVVQNWFVKLWNSFFNK